MSIGPQRLGLGEPGGAQRTIESRGGCMSTRAAEEDVALVANA
jgi:hypothetical protein